MKVTIWFKEIVVLLIKIVISLMERLIISQ